MATTGQRPFGAASTVKARLGGRAGTTALRLCARSGGVRASGVGSVVVRQVGPQRRPRPGDVAEHDREALLLVVETDAVIDGGERAASVEVRRGVCRAVETGQQRASVADRRDPPFAEPV